MARIFITGSSRGIGLMTGQLLAAKGHSVVLHARTAARAACIHSAGVKTEAVLVGDVSSLSAMASLAAEANAMGRFDAVIHNVGIGFREPARRITPDGLSELWAVNVLAPYVLTTLMLRPSRLVYVSSGLHLSGDATLEDLQWSRRLWDGSQAYADSKLQNVLMAFAVARRCPDVISNAVSPGWVATRMGGEGANDDLDQAHRTQAWLAESDDPEARASGGFYYHGTHARLHRFARDPAIQDRLLAACRDASGISLSGCGEAAAQLKAG